MIDHQITPIKTPVNHHAHTETEQIYPVGQLIRHYKGGLYRIKGQSTLESDGSVLILYQSIDPLARQDVWARPEAVFHEPIKGSIPALKDTKRFMPISEPLDDGLKYYLAQYPNLVPTSTLALIKSHYDHPLRFYSGWWKVLDMFSRAMSLNISLTPEQIIAMLYLDIINTSGVYDGVNELMSRKMLFAHRVKLGSFSEKISDAIISDSVNHISTIAESEWVLDLDMAPLADSYLHFDAYNQMIWLEYRHLVDDHKDFTLRRLRYLRTLLETHPRVFYRMTDKESMLVQNAEDYRIAGHILYGKQNENH